MQGTVLVLGAERGLFRTLEALLDDEVAFRSAYTAAETDGTDVDVIVVAGSYPIEELTEVRVHPRLYDKPVILVAPGHTLRTQDWSPYNVWPVTRCGLGVLDDIVDLTTRLLAKARHPSARQPAPALITLAAS